MAKKTMTSFKLPNNATISTYITTAQSLESFRPHPSIQRSLDTTYANKLKRALLNNSLGWAPIGTLLTVPIDGVNYVFDGQHRLYAIEAVIQEQRDEQDNYQQLLAQYDQALVRLNERLNDNSPDEVDVAAMKKQLNCTNPPVPPQMSKEVESFLNSPVTIVQYEGLDEAQLKELFTSFNMGRKVNTNLLVSFAAGNSELVDEIVKRGWAGKYVELKAGKNSSLFGITDVAKLSDKIGMESALELLTQLFDKYDYFDAIEKVKLEPYGLYTGVSKCLGVSVRFLNATAKALNCLTDPNQFSQAIGVIVECAHKLMTTPVECNALMPGIYVTSKTGFALTSATVVEGLLFPWLTWHLHIGGVHLELPRTFITKLFSLEESLPEGIDNSPITDVIEVFSTLAPKPKQVRFKRNTLPTMSAPAQDREQLLLDLDPNDISL
jgi:hypothetical protein